MGVPAANKAVMRLHRELAQAHHHGITGDTLLTTMLADEVHHQFHNDI